MSYRVDAAYTLEAVKVTPIRENRVTSYTEPVGARVDDIKESSPESVEVEECEEEDEGNWLHLAELL
jgi:hypothetical protein